MKVRAGMLAKLLLNARLCLRVAGCAWLVKVTGGIWAICSATVGCVDTMIFWAAAASGVVSTIFCNLSIFQ